MSELSRAFLPKARAKNQAFRAEPRLGSKTSKHAFQKYFRNLTESSMKDFFVALMMNCGFRVPEKLGSQGPLNWVNRVGICPPKFLRNIRKVPNNS